MKKLLIYMEPHPIRNSYTQFLEAARLLLRSVIDNCPQHYEFKLFSNHICLDYLIHWNDKLSCNCIYPTKEEIFILTSLFMQWQEKSITMRNNLVLGQGEITTLYYNMLKRIYKIYPFDCILLWSDNGAAKKFARDRNIDIVFAELGPTRAPFHPTIYFDPEGTNAFASIAHMSIEDLRPNIVVPRETWLARQSVLDVSTEIPGIIDMPFTLSSDFEIPPSPYIYIALQLADDLNTLLCSDFDSPADFIRYVADDLISSGFAICVKGHPAAKTRSYNYIKQLEALDVAQQRGATIIPEDSGMQQSLNIIHHAHAVVTINSSVSFEAMLCGKASFVCGRALYDLGNAMRYTKNNLVSSCYNDEDSIDILSAFLCCHYLHPSQTIKKTDIIFRIFDFLAEHKRIPQKEFWSSWARYFDYGYRFLLDKKAPSNTSLSSILSRGLNNLILKKDLDHNILSIIDTQHSKVKNLSIIRNKYIICIDNSTKNNNSIHIYGWSLESKNLTPPSAILVIHKDKILSFHSVSITRHDVEKFFKVSTLPVCGFDFSFPAVKNSSAGEYELLFLSEADEAQFYDGKLCEKD